MRAAMLLAAVLSASAASAQEAYSEAQRARVTPVVEVVRRHRDAVVNVAATQVMEVRGGGFLDLFETPHSRRMKTNSVGSGAVIHPSGYILTNAHVVAQATELKVIFADKSELPAVVVASLPDDDLAILKVRARGPLKALKLGRSNDLLVGETVVAIGDPLGLQHSVTTGVVSAVGRDFAESARAKFHDIIQTDAAINPGNSGGPLLNVMGELIGVNTAIRTDAQNVGFAIPADRVRALLPELLGVEHRGRVRLGIRWGEADGRGVQVAGVEPNSPAQRARLVPGQVVTQVAGVPATSLVDVLVTTLEQPVGRPFAVTVQEGGASREVRLMVEELARPDGARLALERLGLRLGQLEAATGERLGLRGPAIVVREAPRGGPASRSGIERGDLVTQLGRYGVRELEALGELLEGVRAGDEVALTVIRVRGGTLYRSVVAIRAQ